MVSTTSTRGRRAAPVAVTALVAALAAGSGAHAQVAPAPGPVTLPLTYRSQRPLADALAPSMRRHKAQAIGAAGGGQFLGIDTMHLSALPPGGVAALDLVVAVEEGTNAVKVFFSFFV